MPLPSWIKLATDVPSRADLAAVSTPLADVLANVAAENAPLRIVYGRAQVGAQIANMLVHGGRLIVQTVWCEGEIDAVESVSINNEALPAGVTATHYTGTAGQTVNATLAAAFAAQGIVYADALPGIAYSVVSIPATDSAGFPDLVATIRGRKVFDTRTSTVAWSDNPALCLADFIASPAYGLGLPVDAASVTAVANDNDALVGGLKRRRIGLVIDGVAPTRQHIEALRAYAGCWVIDSGAGIQLVSDRPRATDHTVTAADVIAGTFRLRQLGVADLPTVVHVTWTDTTTTPWSEKTATAYAAGVLEGLTPRRESTVPLLGIQTYAQALREGTERVNHFSLENIEAEWDAFDEALAYEKGDVVSVAHPVGLTGKLMRITDVRPSGPGRFRVTAREYDSAAYSDAIASEPSTPDTSLPNPAAPPKPTGVTAVEEVYQLQNGNWASRIKLTWDVVDFVYLRDYRVEIYGNSDLIETASPGEAIYRTGPVKEGTQYTCKVAVISAIGATSAWEQDLVTALGKSLVPSDVPSVSAFEAGGTVYGQCAEAVDIDILRYKWKYWPVGGGWATGTLIDKADSLRCTTSQIPVGTWVLGVKAVDSIQQESVNATTCPITVSSDTAAFFVNKYDSTNPTLTNMAEYSLGRDPTKRYFVTEDNVAWDTKFSSAMDTYTNPLSSYHNSVTSTWEGEGEDFGQLLGGQWTGEATVAAISGTIASYMGFSTTVDSGYTFYSGLSHKQNARWAKLKHEATGTSTMSVTIPEQNIRLDAIPHEETHSGTSSATSPTTVHLDNEYVATKNITITPQSSTPVIATADNIGLDAPNPADKHANITITGTYAVATSVAGTYAFVRGRHSLPTTGKWYWEVKVDAVGANGYMLLGICSRTVSLVNTYTDAASMFYNTVNGNRYPGNIAYGAAYTAGDVIGIAYDADNGTIEFHKNNTSQGQITGLTGEKFLSVGHYDTGSSCTLRIDKSQFSYTPPTGFKALPYGYDVNISDTSNARVAKPFMTTHDGV